MKKLLIVSALTFALASCSMPGTSTPSDYASLYNANVKAEMAKLDETYKTFYGTAREITGNIRSAATVLNEGTPMHLSGSSDYSSVENGGLAQLNFLKPEGYAHMTQSGAEVNMTVSASEVNIIGGMASSLLRYATPAATVTSTNPELQQQLQTSLQTELAKYAQFDGKWIDLNNTGDMPESAKKAMEKLATLTPKQIEEYMIAYHIFTATGTTTNTGSIYTFPVELNRANIVALADKVSLDFTGSGMTEEQKTELNNALAKIVVENATVSYDTTDPLYSVSHMTLSSADAPTQKLALTASRVKEVFTIGLTAINANKEMGTFTLTATTSGKDTDFVANILADLGSGTPGEIMSLHGKIHDSVLQTLTGSLNAMVASGKLEYTHKDKLSLVATAMGEELLNVSNQFTGENFEGKAILQGIEVANWKAQIANKVLTGLSLVVQDVSNMTPAEKPLLSMDLTKQENSDMIAGTAHVALAGQDTGSAHIGLEVNGSKKFGILIDQITAADPAMTAMIPLQKFELYATQKVSDTTKTVEIPKETVPMSEVEKALGISSTVYENPAYEDMIDVWGLEMTHDMPIEVDEMAGNEIQ